MTPARTGNYRARLAGRSSRRALAVATVIAGMVMRVTPAIAQGAPATKAQTDSLAARVERAEEALELLKQQMANQGGVQAKSRLAVEVGGQVLVNAFGNSRRVNNVDVPIFTRPDSASGLPLGGGGMAIRQTTLGIVVTAQDVMGGTFTGDLDVDFYGGQQPSSGGRTFPLIRMRTARATIRWAHADVMVGQDAPLMSPLNPVSLASVGVPGFTGAGNLWLWLPQARVGLHTAGPMRVGIQGAVLAPMTGDPAGLFDTDFDVAERSKRPFVEGRAHVAWGADEMAGEIGVSAHGGWYATPNSTNQREGMAVGADAKVPLSSWLELRGEWYSGDGMRALGGGAIGQLFDTKNQPIHSTGYWAQANVKPTTRVTIGGGIGMDDPDDASLAASARLRNRVTEAHLHLLPGGPMIVGFEWRRIETTYAAGPVVNDHLNLAVGFRF